MASAVGTKASLVCHCTQQHLSDEAGGKPPPGMISLQLRGISVVLFGSQQKGQSSVNSIPHQRGEEILRVWMAPSKSGSRSPPAGC